MTVTENRNTYLDQVVAQGAQLEQDLRGKRAVSPSYAPPPPAPGAAAPARTRAAAAAAAVAGVAAVPGAGGGGA